MGGAPFFLKLLLVATRAVLEEDASMAAEPRLWALARKLQALAQTGLEFNQNEYDRDRYEAVGKIAAELMASHCDAPVKRFAELFAQQSGYATPKVDVRAAVIEDGKILLVQEASNGLWTLPGGWADQNISPAENAVKEAREESGLEVEPIKLIACLDKDKQGHPRQPEQVYRLIFLCRRTGGSLATSHETSGVDFFSADELPSLCPHRSGRQYLELAWRHAADPALPTAFD